MHTTHDATPSVGASLPVPACDIRAAIARYDRAVEAVREAQRAVEEAREAVDGSGARFSMRLQDDYDLEGKLLCGAWESLLAKSHIRTILSRQTKRRLEDQLEGRGEEKLPPFTFEHIEATMEGWAMSAPGEFLAKVRQAFDALHPRRMTNRPTAFGRKVILEWGVDPWSAKWARGSKSKPLSLSRNDALDDLEDAACTALGRTLGSYHHGIRTIREVPRGEWVDVPAPDGGPKLFTIKAHLSGTIHVRISPEAVDALNRALAKGSADSLGRPAHERRGGR